MFEIGNSLHEARVRRSIELVQAELATKIRVKYLRALEDERFEQLPSQTYVKGFLRTYAEYLGLDGQLYVDEYNSRFVAGDEGGDARPRRSSVRPERRTRRVETAVVVVALAIVTIVTVVVISAWQTSGSGKAQTKVQHHTAATTAKKAHKAVHRATPFLLISAVKGAGSYVAVHSGSPTGRLLFQGTIQKGRSEPFRGRHFWLDVSSPENLRILVKGKQVVLNGLKPITFTVDSDGVHAA